MACHSRKSPPNAETRRAYEVRCTLAHLQHVNCCNLATLVKKNPWKVKHVTYIQLFYKSPSLEH